MPQYRLLKDIIDILNKNKIPYMLTGSIVSSLQGNPRSTHDIDVIITTDEDNIDKLINALPKEEFYFSERAIKQAINDKSQFNIINNKQRYKIDFWMLTDSAFDKSRFSRRQKLEFSGFEIVISSPEDTILEKLYWSKLSGGSSKQYNDALRVYELQYGILNTDYIDYWSNKLKVAALLEKIKSEAQIVE